MKKNFLIIFCLISISAIAKLEFAAYPAGGFSNETGIEAGLLSYLRFLPTPPDSTSQFNSVYFLSKFSTKKQFVLQVTPDIFFKKNIYNISTPLKFQQWPTSYYGIGNSTDINNSERYTPLIYSAKISLSRKIVEKISASIHYDWQSFEIIKHKTGSKLEVYNSPSISSGVGFKLIRNSSNAHYYPTSGSIQKFIFTKYNSAIGSDNNFSKCSFDLRKYISLNKLCVLSFQAYAGFSQGDIPLNRMYELDDFMRGIPTNLHPDANIAVVCSEFKIFPWRGDYSKRIGFATFLEIGNVFDEFSNYEISENKINYGLGFRYSLFSGDRLNFRFDIGFGENGSEITIKAREAF